VPALIRFSLWIRPLLSAVISVSQILIGLFKIVLLIGLLFLLCTLRVMGFFWRCIIIHLYNHGLRHSVPMSTRIDSLLDLVFSDDHVRMIAYALGRPKYLFRELAG
jgi:hypothetical protein